MKSEIESEKGKMKSKIKIMEEGQLKLVKENCQTKIRIELLNQEIR